MEISKLIGKNFTSVVNKGDEILFTANDGTMYRMFHEQSCCENVRVEDICGDLNDLVNTPIVRASENSNSVEDGDDGDYESYTYTFYHITTIKGTVVIRWLGTSNGYYSESVSLEEVEKPLKSTVPDGYSFAY